MALSKNLTFCCALVFFLSSCISLNPNGYKYLTTTGRQQLKPFSVDSLSNRAERSNWQYTLTELTGSDMKQVLQHEKYTWIYFWLPYCKGPHCRGMFYNEKISDQFASKGVRLIMLSQIYDSAVIVPQVRLSGFSQPVYVIKDSAYTHNTRKNRDRFVYEITGDKEISKQRPAHLIFKGDSLIYSGVDMSAHIMDSVLSNGQLTVSN